MHTLDFLSAAMGRLVTCERRPFSRFIPLSPLFGFPAYSHDNGQSPSRLALGKMRD